MFHGLSCVMHYAPPLCRYNLPQDSSVLKDSLNCSNEQQNWTYRTELGCGSERRDSVFTDLTWSNHVSQRLSVWLFSEWTLVQCIFIQLFCSMPPQVQIWVIISISVLFKTFHQEEMFSFSAAVFGNVIKPNTTDVVYEEGSNVTLLCSHSPGATDYIHWYRQYGTSKPEFLVLTYGSAKEAEVSNVDPRFSIKVEKREKNHVDLEISSAAVSDSALYYCALRPQWQETHQLSTKTCYNERQERKDKGNEKVVTANYSSLRKVWEITRTSK